MKPMRSPYAVDPSLEVQGGYADSGRVTPRPLTDREAEILDFLLTPDFPGRDALRAQANTAKVVGRCSCGCATIDLATDPEAPFAEGVMQHMAVEAGGAPRRDG